MNYTTIKQSKRLLELGLNPESADMFYPNAPNPSPCVDNGMPKGDVFIPAWSLGALLELMPKTMKGIPEKAVYFLTLKENALNAWKCCYEHFAFGELQAFPAQSTPLEAAYNTIVWMLENNYIKPEKTV